jgi:exopolysaccharide production protein ExoY
MTAHYQDFIQNHNVVVPANVPAQKFGVYRSLFKRSADIFLVILSLPASVPLILLLAFLVAIDGGQPFYAQDRVGRGGRIFKFWKLRTMVPNAKAHLAEYLSTNAEAREEWELNQKLRNDPRITPIGRFLRKTSLDELPQLWNVLIGDMSLVGPRPMMPEQQRLYPGGAYYALRPGITGLWQVSDRNDCSFSQRADFDAEYYARLSLGMDIKILISTVAVVLNATGC